MHNSRTQSGFSLMETLLAVGTLAIGLVFVAGTFLAGVYLATISTEGTIATVVADEAFAKIQLYGLDLDDPSDPNIPTDGYVRYDGLGIMPPDEYLYPSTETAGEKQYCWTAICKRDGEDSRLVDVFVFVCRRVAGAKAYWTGSSGALTETNTPSPVLVNLVPAAGAATTQIVAISNPDPGNEEFDERTLINDGAELIDNRTGEIYRVLERYSNAREQIRLDRAWPGTDLSAAEGAAVWVMPHPVSGGRDPLVAIYHKVLRF